MDRHSESPQAKKRRLARAEPHRQRQPRRLYGINVNDMEWTDNIRECPVYRPSKEDFEDFFAYLEKISPNASNYGICKIICPLSDIVPAGVVVKKELENFKFEPSVQPLKYATWATQEDKISYYKRGRQYKYREFEKMANQVFAEKYSSFGCLSCKVMEREFWEEMAQGEDGSVEYGVNVDGTAFSNNDELGRSKWNLKILPRLPESTLRLLKKKVPGITNPMLYIGMVFSTFAWHVEDHYLYSINYLHSGAPKTWYGVPGSQARTFEQVAFDNVYSIDVMQSYESDGAAQVLAEKTTMVPPSLFMKHHVSVYKVVQMPGEFVITFPRAYHAGFSHGFNCAEAVNFAGGDWFPYGSIAAKRYSLLETQPLIPFEELLCREATLLCQKMTTPSETPIASSTSHCAIMASCITHIDYHRAARRKLEPKKKKLKARSNTYGTVICGFCSRDRYLAFLMCHHCKKYPTCVFHGITVFCSKCDAERSLFLSDNMRLMEAAADFFENNRHLLSTYLEDTVQLQQEITELYELERDDGQEASTSAASIN